MKSNNYIEAGKILIAEPFMNESSFSRSVIAICDHSNEEGTVGFILNRPLKAKFSELISEVSSDIEFRINYGGPVATDTIHYIHNIGELLEESVKVCRGVYWSGNFEKLKVLINKGLVGFDNIRFFIGYSGWSKGQLKEELVGAKSWLISDLDANYIFKSNPSQLWKQVLNHKGDTYSVIAQIPQSQINN